MNYDYDVIVVGAGPAGVTAARECAVRGARTLVLEGRDRIGGRTHTELLDDGTPVDLGGTYVNWTQPHVWAEIVRYGLVDQVKPGRVLPDWLVTYNDGAAVWQSAAPSRAAAASAAEKVLADSAKAFPAPALPLFNRAAVEAVDGMSMTERLAQVDLTPDEFAYAGGFLSGMSGRSLDEASYSGLLRWFAMGGNNFADFDDMIFGWKLGCGIGGLLQAMLDDGGAELRFNSVVSAISSTADGVTVTVGDEQITARSVVIATPSGAWLNLDLSPALPAPLAEMTTAGVQIGSASKGAARIKGETRAFTFPLGGAMPFMMFTDRFTGPDEQIVTVFPGLVPDDPPLSRETVASWIAAVLPHAEVLDVRVSQHTKSDPMSGGPSFMRIGHLTKYEPHLNTRLDDRVFFASSDLAAYFHSFIDGGIESGLRAGRDVQQLLAKS